MPIIITLTGEETCVDGKEGTIYDYQDKILKNIFTNAFEVFYSGQNKGRMDKELIKAIKNNEVFKIYSRPKINTPFNYLGNTNISSIIQNRQKPVNKPTNKNERLQIHLIINNPVNISIPINAFTGSGKFKKDVLVHTGLRNRDNESIIQHNRNTNLGFYYYI